MSLVVPTELPRFTGTPVDLRRCATVLGVAAWRLRQVADEFGGAQLPDNSERQIAARTAGMKLHEASSEVRSALVEYADTLQALLARLSYQQALTDRLYGSVSETTSQLAGSRTQEAEQRSRSNAIREEVHRIIDEFRQAEAIAAKRIETVCADRSAPGWSAVRESAGAPDSPHGSGVREPSATPPSETSGLPQGRPAPGLASARVPRQQRGVSGAEPATAAGSAPPGPRVVPERRR